MAKLFGFKIQKDEENTKGVVSPVPQNNEDSSDYYVSSGFYGQYVDIDGVFKSEFELIKRYREMALHPEVDSAIEDIINEAIVSDQNDSPVEIDLENLPASKQLKDLIRDEFKAVKEILDFDKKCHEILRNWYIDGRIYYHKVIDIQKPEEGLKEVRYIDPLKIKLVRKLKQDPSLRGAIKQVNANNPADIENPEIEEFYQYDPAQTQGKNALGAIGQTPFSTKQRPVKIAPDAITFCHSGLVDRNKQTILSYLHKSIKALNQLRMIEDSLVIYRLSRAPERRIFYIDVGNLPKVKAEQYLRDVMARYRNKLVYDSSTGEMRDDKKHMSMLEDFWLPRREGGRGTEITTLPGGQNLGELKDVEYFKKKLFNSLNLPPSRLTDDNKGFNLVKTTEVLRDELKFTKFIGRLRKRFSEMFQDMLKTQLILKGIIAPEDWDDMKEHIQYDFLFDNHFNELKNIEMMNQRMMTVTQMDPFVGKYYSIEHVRRHILGQKDKDFREMDKQMRQEIDQGLVMDPQDVNTFDTMDRQNTAFQPEIQAQQADDAVERELDKEKRTPKPPVSASKPTNNNK